MANVLTNIQPKILARGLSTLREMAVMPRVVNSDYAADAAEHGDTIDVPVPTAVGTRAVAPGPVPPAAVDVTPAKVQIQLDQWQQNDPIHLTDKEIREIDRNRHYIPMQLDEAVRGLANDVNIHIHSQYRQLTSGIFGAVGTAGTTPFATTVLGATNARKLLNQQRAPKSSRIGVLDFDAEANALALAPFADADKTMSAQVKIEGEIGRKYGIDWMSDDHIVTHTAGTLTDGSSQAAITNGAESIGAVTVDIDETSLTGTIVIGDIISFAGHSQTYCVIENTSSGDYGGAGDVTTGVYTAGQDVSNAISDLGFYPALIAAVGDGEAMTLTPTHQINLVMHRDAFAYATRPLAATTQELALGSNIMSIQDPHTGISLRLEVSRQHKQVVWEFDHLWGAGLVRPELAVRLLG